MVNSMKIDNTLFAERHFCLVTKYAKTYLIEFQSFARYLSKKYCLVEVDIFSSEPPFSSQTAFASFQDNPFT